MTSYTDPHHSPPWSRTMKIIVAVIAILLFVGLLYQFNFLIRPLVFGVILAYLLNPIIVFFESRTRFGSWAGRTTIVIAVYVLLAILVLGALTGLGFTIYFQASNLIEVLPGLIESAPERLDMLRQTFSEPITIVGFTFTIPIPDNNEAWQNLFTQISEVIQPYLANVGGSIGQVAISAGAVFGWSIFVYFVSMYLSFYVGNINEGIGAFAELPGYRQDAERLWREFGSIWNAYIRGQAILGLVIGVVVWLSLSIVGVENALTVGLISGALEFIPYVGPVMGALTAIIAAVAQDGNIFNIPQYQFVLIVLGIMILIQQVENNILVPRIIGDVLDLNPLVIIIAAVMGGAAAGLLGVIIASPIMATIKLISTYAWRKLFDLPPFPEPEQEPEEKMSWGETLWQRWQLWRASREQNSKHQSKSDE